MAKKYTAIPIYFVTLPSELIVISSIQVKLSSYCLPFQTEGTALAFLNVNILKKHTYNFTDVGPLYGTCTLRN